MDGLLFTLVNAEDPGQIVAWGMEITFDASDIASERSIAVVYRFDPASGEETHSRHVSAEGACAIYNRALPINVELAWHEAHVPVPK